MKKLIILSLIFILALGCISKPMELKKSGFCAKVKESIADNFEIYGLFLQDGPVTSNLHYCEYYLGKTLALKLLYTEEPDTERAYYESYNGIRNSANKDNLFILATAKNSVKEVNSFHITTIDKKNGEILAYAAAFDEFSSITVSATYVPGYPNPFVEGKLLEKIAVNALTIANN